MIVAEELVDTKVEDAPATESAAPEKAPAADAKAPVGDKAEKSPVGDKGAKTAATEDKGGKKTILDGADAEADDKAKEDAAAAKGEAKAVDRAAEIKTLRENLAKHYSAGDKKAYDKELKRLERLGIERPEQVYGLYRELDNKLNGGGLVKVPGKDAKPEEWAEFHKAMGVPEKPEELVAAIKLESGAVIGEADKPRLNSFGAALHKAGATPAVMNAAANWYYQQQEETMTAIDEADDAYLRESQKALKEEFGPAFKRTMGAIPTLFATAPGGSDEKNTSSVYYRLKNGRTADGRLIGDDPAILRWLASVAQDVNPIATVVEGGNQGVKALDTELEEIRALRKSDDPSKVKKYWSADVQARELELINAKQKSGQRA